MNTHAPSNISYESQHSRTHIANLFCPYSLCWLPAQCTHTTHTSVIITLFKCNFILTTLDWCYVFLHVASLLLLLVFCTKGVRTLYLSANWVRDLIFRSHTPIFFSSFVCGFAFLSHTHSLSRPQTKASFKMSFDADDYIAIQWKWREKTNSSAFIKLRMSIMNLNDTFFRHFGNFRTLNSMCSCFHVFM